MAEREPAAGVNAVRPDPWWFTGEGGPQEAAQRDDSGDRRDPGGDSGRQHDSAGAASDHHDLGHDHGADDSVCAICPVCQLLRVARRLRPETVEHLTRAATELGAALQSLASSSPVRSDPSGDSDSVAEPPPRPRQRVPLDEPEEGSA
ncbi:MAG: hypothetical protein EPO13_00795 [Actinomycetota bacterium]|nr:MAG: hypothetical protein EPO13_00795 [Actinomycetota bacterium]